MSANVQEVTDATFDTDVLENDKPVVVDFWAAWCGPCRMVAPEIEKLAAKYAGTVEVRKLDVDANPQIAMRYGIMSIPTVAMFKKGEAPRAAHRGRRIFFYTRSGYSGTPGAAAHESANFPGDETIERRYRAWLRWNAAPDTARQGGRPR